MIAIVSHDAGGAEVLSSFVRRHNIECLFVLEGSACNIFKRKLGSVKTTSLDEALGRADRILCGSSWQSDLELNAIKLARSVGKPSAVFLDHWVNYSERFERSGVTCLPDEVWVGDKDADLIARNVFAGTGIRFVENPYFQDIREELEAISTMRSSCPGQISVLYVCEPVREHALMQHGDARYWGYTEEEALRYFLSNSFSLGKAIGKIVLRPHPSEVIGKYGWAQMEFDLPIVAGGVKSLVEEISESDVVVGCESMAMVVGLLAGKRVISSIPPGGKACALPHAEIEHLQFLGRGSEYL